MSIIRDSDLFDFDGYAARIKAMEGVTSAWAHSLVADVGRVQTAFNEAQKEIAPLREGLKSVSITKDGSDKQITDYIQKIGQAGERVKLAQQSLSAYSEAQELNGKVIVDLTAKLGALKQRYESLDKDQKDYTKQQRSMLGEMKTLTRSIDAQSKSLQFSKQVIDAAEGSMNHLKRQTSDLKKSLDTLPDAYDKSTGALNRQNKAAVALNDQYQKNIALLGKVESGQRVFGRNVGNYPQGQQQQRASPSVLSSAAGMSTQLAGAGLAIAGIDSALGAIQKVGDITLQFDSLDSALKVVSNDTALFTQRQAMLQRISEDLGQDLSVVEETYTNLTASSKGTRLEGEATDKIFESIVGTMGRLKRPSEQVQGALLAVGQMMSKGTIQSEELRGQLSERLPGAFQIMARALGVTTSKLGDMLKSGEVLSSDALPKFAEELEKTFNPNHVRRVEGFGASLARLRNEGVEWIKSFDIGDSAGAFISNITGMARSVREFFSSSVEQSTNRLNEQTDAVNRLESQLPALLTRYDELKSKSKLSADEQKELQTVVNSLVSLAPSAATGFDIYGNALDVNKGKVLSFTAAQQLLNAELNKGAIADLRKQTAANLQQSELTQRSLNKGTKQQSFNFMPYAMRSAEEKRMATDKNAVKNREVALSDNDKLSLQSQLQEQNKQVELSIIQRLQLGDKLSAADEKFIAGSANSGLKQTKVIAEYNEKISELNLKQGDLLIKGDEASRKQRETVLKELKSYQDKKAELLNPKLPGDKSAEEEDPAAEKRRKAAATAAKKAQVEADRQLRDSLTKSEATAAKELTILNDQHQDGLVNEQDFIEQRLQKTLAGLDARQSLLEKAGKKETDDYQKVLEAKTKAEMEYKRSQLQLDLKSNKGSTADQLADLDTGHNEGSVNDSQYVEQRHDILKKGLERDLAILEDAGQKETELYRATNTALGKEQADYEKRKLKVEEKGWKDQLEKVKDSLGAIDLQIKTDLEKQLGDLEENYNKQAAIIQKKMVRGKLSEPEGEKQLADLKIRLLNDSMAATETAYSKDATLSRALVQEKIDNLTEWLNAATRTPGEIAAVEADKVKLRQELEENLAKDKMRLATEVADHQKKTSEEGRKSEVQQAKFSAQERKQLWDQTIATIEAVQQASSTIISNSYQKDIDSLTSQKEREIALVGDNADAKAKIEQDYNKQIGEVRRKQAVAEKAAAIFQIGLNTAVAITDVLRTGGGAHYLDFGVSAGILSALITASGIAQIAAVLSAPMPPAYKLGKQASDAYTGPALAGEAGAELWVGADGSSQILDRPTLIDTKAGDTIYTASQTSAIVSTWKKQQSAELAHQEIALNHQAANSLQGGRQSEMRSLMQEVFHADPSRHPLTESQIERAFGRALDKRPADVTIYDAEGVKRGRKTANSYTEYMDKRTKW